MGDPGVNDYSVSLDTQEVIVKGTLPYEDVYAKIQKTGKEVRTIEFREKVYRDIYNDHLGQLEDWAELDRHVTTNFRSDMYRRIL